MLLLSSILNVRYFIKLEDEGNPKWKINIPYNLIFYSKKKN